MRQAPTRPHQPIRRYLSASDQWPITRSVDGPFIAGHIGSFQSILEHMPADVSLGPSTPPQRTGTNAEAVGAPGVRPRLAMAVATIVVSISVVLGVRPVSDPSPWLHLKVGAFLLDGGRFGLPDPWAPFATRTYVPTEWLPAIVGQETYQAFGMPGIAWLRCAGILGLLCALVWSTRRSASTATSAPVCLIALIGACLLYTSPSPRDRT